jgi:large subunit ribosomal protein L23
MVLSPKITEKSMVLAERGVYVFEVPISANKIQVLQAVESSFKVKVVGINSLVHKGKLKRFGRKLGRQVDTKKMIVRLAKGQSIAVFGEEK